MNTQEREQLTRFLQQLAQAGVGSKDPEAEQLIRAACAQQADAHYLLVQRSLILGQALENAQAEIARLKQVQETAVAGSGSFLNSNGWGNTPAPAPARAFSQPPQYPAAAAPTPSTWGSGLLGTVASTAAGVVAGSFLFQGIEHLMGNHPSGSGLLSSNDVQPEKHAANNFVDTDSTPVDFDSLGPAESSDPDWM